MFSFVLVTVEVFECSGPRSTARLPKRLIPLISGGGANCEALGEIE
jgi:hypothetical protein